jgi:peptidoglycan hydrolase-like protein with peptidoglycan-binding domain
MGLFGLIPGAKKLKKKIETDLSTQLGRPVELPTPTDANILMGATAGALASAGAALQLVPGLGTAVGLALGAAAKAVSSLQSGDTKGAAFAAFGVLAPVLGDYAAETFAPAVGDVLTTAKAVDSLRKGVAVSAGALLPGLPSIVGETVNADGLSVLADKVLAAKGIPELAAKANAIIAETTSLAASGNANAKVALTTLSNVSAARAKRKVKAGVEQAMTSSAAVALAAQVEAAVSGAVVSLAADLDAARLVKGDGDKQWSGYWGALGAASAKAKADADAAAAAAAAAKAAADQYAREREILASIAAAEAAAHAAAVVVKAQTAELKAKVAAVRAAGFPAIPRTLKRGMTGYDVLVWQQVMNGGGMVTVQVNGDFDAVTEAATRDWQRQKGLPQTGTVDLTVLRAAGAAASGFVDVYARYAARQAEAAAGGPEAAAAAAAAAASTAADAAAAAAAALASASTPQLGAAAPQLGFIVTPAARILDGLQWLEDASGLEGVLIRTTGPEALRRDATVRRWKRA